MKAILIEAVRLIVTVVVCFCVGYSMHTMLGRQTMLNIFAGFFCCCTLYLMYKNLMIFLADGEGSLGWLVLMMVSFPITIWSLTKVTGYFTIH